MNKYLYSSVIASLLTAVTAYAASATDAQPLQVTVPKLKGGIEMNVGGMLTRPSNGDLNYGSTGNSSASNAGNIQTNTGSGLNAGLGYNVPGTGNDVQMQWSQMHN